MATSHLELGITKQPLGIEEQPSAKTEQAKNIVRTGAQIVGPCLTPQAAVYEMPIPTEV